MNHAKLMEFLGRVTADMGATGSAGLVVIGNRLGLYRALAQGPATPVRFAERTGYHERYLHEWLRNQAAGGYVSYDPARASSSSPRSRRSAWPTRTGRTSPPGSSSAWATCAPSPGSPRRSGPGTASPGTSTTRTSSSGATRSTGPATSPSWCRTGSRRWRACTRS